MKNLIVLILLFVVGGASTVKAQGIIDKANSLLNKADNASSTANRAGGTGDKVLGIFKKKKKVDAAATAPANALTGYRTVITIKGKGKITEDALLDMKNSLIISWSGMRGIVSLAIAIGLPATLADGSPFPERHAIIFISVVVVLFTLIGQGLTLPWIVKRLKTD